MFYLNVFTANQGYFIHLEQNVQVKLIITHSLGSIKADCVIREPYYNEVEDI